MLSALLIDDDVCEGSLADGDVGGILSEVELLDACATVESSLANLLGTLQLNLACKVLASAEGLCLDELDVVVQLHSRECHVVHEGTLADARDGLVEELLGHFEIPLSGCSVGDGP